MFPCMKTGCPWACGAHRQLSCADRIVNRGLSSVLIAVLVGSFVFGMLSLV